jgi:hypothetical protein
MKLPVQGRVIHNYQAAYPDPLIVKAGDLLTLGKHDDQWPGWVWCAGLNGKEGWVPESYLEIRSETGIARRDYMAEELTVQVGEQVTLWELEAGWFWASNGRNLFGWVPAEHVEVIEHANS